MAAAASTLSTPILTDIASDQLECTLDCVDYHCLLRLKSSAKSVSSPDISSIAVIPIDVIAAVSVDQERIIHLLPSMLHIDFDESNKAVPDRDSLLASFQHHPCHELIQISLNLQAQLKERLQDASDGAIIISNISIPCSNGPMEDFLLRSEAVFNELIAAVNQHMRREEASHRYTNSNNDRQRSSKKRARISSTTSTQSYLSSTTPPPLEYYHALLLQLRTLQNMHNVTDITLHKDDKSNAATNLDDNTSIADITRLSITCQDNKQRIHTWHAELYPTVIMTVDLPAEFDLEDVTVQGGANKTSTAPRKWWANTNNANEEYGDNISSSPQQLLPRIQLHFEHTINNYQTLFDELDDLDSNLWILEPTLPARRSYVERRIALWEGGASVVIVLDHEKPRGVPVMVRFLGVSTATIKAFGGSNTSGSIAEWRASFTEFVAEEEKDGGKTTQQDTGAKKRWSEERSIRENLELWLGSSLPSPLSTEKSDYLVECGICYSHRLPTMTGEGDNENENDEEGPIPEEKCSNPQCNRYYHESCLFEWLHSLPTARVSFDRIFGSCPYCCESVSVKVLNRTKH